MAGEVLSLSRSLDTLFGAGTVGDVPDGQLLQRFTAGNDADEPAFDALVQRHGPMVLRVCRRLLNDPNDAEDAFQATFLVLLRQARSIRHGGSLAAWLHGVAQRVASRARVESARRRRIEQHAIRPPTARNADPDRLDLEALIDVELARLPRKYREPIVLCYLEELTHEGAADRLGWPVGTVRGRLARARVLLRSRLIRRGITASAALAAVGALNGLARGATVPTPLREATVRSAVQAVAGRAIATVASARVATWVTAASRSLAFSRWTTAVGVPLLLATVATGLGLATLGASTSQPQQAQIDRPTPPEPREEVRREMLQLKGTWSSMQTVESTVDGVPQKPKQFKMVWSIDRDLITDTDDDGFADKTFRYTPDPHKTPKTLDLTLLNNGLALFGIYKLDGDELTVCMSASERPTDFEAGPYRILAQFHRESRTPAQLAQECPNAPGCFWAVEPKGAVPGSTYTSGINLIAKQDPQGALVVILAYVTRFQGDTPDLEYRPVAFDDQRVRHLPAIYQGGSSGSSSISGVTAVLREYRLDPTVLPFNRVKRLGIEVIPPEVRRAAKAAASVRAMQAARDAGVEILPLPEVGKPFEFSLTDTKGRVIRSAELKGKVVLIDCWAGWCSPCMAKMPQLKEHYKRRHGDGFEVIGVNFDHTRARAEELVKTVDLPWAEVYVPEDDRTRELWADGPGITSLPRLFLIDRAGILRWAGGPGELEEQINSLLE